MRAKANGRKIKSASIAVLAVFLVANTASAKYSGGTGEPNSPYRIATPNDLNDIGNHPEDFNDCFILINDINMAGFTYTTALIAPDINNSSDFFQGTAFTGIFDGNDCVIRNLTIDTADSNNWYLGLFGLIYEPGQVKNLGIEDINVTGGDNSRSLGGLCGANWEGGTISNCYATGSVSGGYSFGGLGGLCGLNNGTISHCYATGSVSGGYAFGSMGGLCGWNNYGTIRNCYATGSVTGGDYCWYLGGLCGANYNIISNCYATGSVSGGLFSWKLGGICGDNIFGTISNCYATGSVTGGDSSDYLGGFCGENNYGTISNCYGVGSVDGNDHLGGFCGYSEGTINNSYFLEGGGPNNGNGAPLTDQEMKQKSSFSGWQFVGKEVSGPNDVWRMCVDGVSYPLLWWQFSTGDFVCPDGVNFIDYSHFAGHWQDTNCGDTNDCERTDLDFSDAVDWKDLKIFCEHWLEGY